MLKLCNLSPVQLGDSGSCGQHLCPGALLVLRGSRQGLLVHRWRQHQQLFLQHTGFISPTKVPTTQKMLVEHRAHLEISKWRWRSVLFISCILPVSVSPPVRMWVLFPRSAGWPLRGSLCTQNPLHWWITRCCCELSRAWGLMGLIWLFCNSFYIPVMEMKAPSYSSKKLEVPFYFICTFLECCLKWPTAECERNESWNSFCQCNSKSSLMAGLNIYWGDIVTKLN